MPNRNSLRPQSKLTHGRRSPLKKRPHRRLSHEANEQRLGERESLNSLYILDEHSHTVGGPYSDVFKGTARHKYSGTKVAVKCILQGKRDEKKIKKSFKSEVILQNRASVNNPGVAKVCGCINDDYILFTEYASMDMKQFIYEFPYTEDDCRYIFLQMLNAIDRCHNNDVYHLDIKLDNFLIDPSTLEVKLVDFGCAQSAKDEKVIIQKKEIETSLPPEYFPLRGQRLNGKRLDYWGLAVVLFELTNNKKPFLNVDHIIRHIVPGGFEEHCSELMRELILTMLHPEEHKRASLKDILESRWINESEDLRIDAELSRLRGHTYSYKSRVVLKNESIKDD